MTTVPVKGGTWIKNNNTDSILRIVIQELFKSIVNIITVGRSYLYTSIFTVPTISINSVIVYNNHQYLLFNINVPTYKEIPKLSNKQ